MLKILWFMRFSTGQYIHNLLENWGLTHTAAFILQVVITIALLFIISYISFFISKYILLRIIKFVVKRTTTTWDDILLEKGVFKRFALLIPAAVLYFVLPYVIMHNKWLFAADSALKVYTAVIILFVVDSFLDALNDIFMTLEISRSRPIKGYIQIIKILIYSIGIIIIISIIINKSPALLLTGLGAISAILLLVFKDPLLGFVSSIQLSSNDMVKPGDWVSLPKHNADGIVIDINLTSVKIQNWDLSITSVPTQSMISDSFVNWKGMEEGAGRRIKRSFFIDMNSIKFCTEEILQDFKKIRLIEDYVITKQNELLKYNQDNDINDSILVNGRRQTNIGVFRAYLQAYLNNHPYLHKNMTMLIRQLDPTDKGLPIEVYAFSTIKSLAEYESIQGDIFDHILAIIPQFGLNVFQNPTGTDFRKKGS